MGNKDKGIRKSEFVVIRRNYINYINYMNYKSEIKNVFLLFNNLFNERSYG